MTPSEALAFIAELFEMPADSLTPDTLRAEIPGWDSMGFLTLMAEFDDRFGIALTPSRIEAMTKVDDILQVLREHQQLAP